jgi:hypothetical protein
VLQCRYKLSSHSVTIQSSLSCYYAGGDAHNSASLAVTNVASLLGNLNMSVTDVLAAAHQAEGQQQATDANGAANATVAGTSRSEATNHQGSSGTDVASLLGNLIRSVTDVRAVAHQAQGGQQQATDANGAANANVAGTFMSEAANHQGSSGTDEGAAVVTADGWSARGVTILYAPLPIITTDDVGVNVSRLVVGWLMQMRQWVLFKVVYKVSNGTQRKEIIVNQIVINFVRESFLHKGEPMWSPSKIRKKASTLLEHGLKNWTGENFVVLSLIGYTFFSQVCATSDRHAALSQCGNANEVIAVISDELLGRDSGIRRSTPATNDQMPDVQDETPVTPALPDDEATVPTRNGARAHPPHAPMPYVQDETPVTPGGEADGRFSMPALPAANVPMPYVQDETHVTPGGEALPAANVPMLDVQDGTPVTPGGEADGRFDMPALPAANVQMLDVQEDNPYSFDSVPLAYALEKATDRDLLQLCKIMRRDSWDSWENITSPEEYEAALNPLSTPPLADPMEEEVQYNRILSELGD